MIGKLITKVLRESSYIPEPFNQQFSPIMIEEGTGLPAACYEIFLSSPTYSKDGKALYNASLSFHIFATSFADIELYQKGVIDTFDNKVLEDNEFITWNLRLESSKHSWNQTTSTFYCEISFSVKFHGK